MQSVEDGVEKFRIPNGTVLPGRAFIAWDENQLGLGLSSDGEEILLVNSNQTGVLDAVRFGGAGQWRFPRTLARWRANDHRADHAHVRRQ